MRGEFVSGIAIFLSFLLMRKPHFAKLDKMGLNDIINIERALLLAVSPNHEE